MTELVGLGFDVVPTVFRITRDVVEHVLRKDELSQFLRQATGALEDLQDSEFDLLRAALTGPDLWDALYTADTDEFDSQLTQVVRASVREGPWGDAAAAYIARRLLEAGLANTNAPLFAKVLDARLARLATSLATERQRADEALLVAHARVYQGLDEQHDLLNRVYTRLDQVLRELPGDQPASVADVLAYLRMLVTYLNQDPWHIERAGGEGLSPADLERSLQVREQNGMPQPADLLADLATDLVILGQPGAGKTWLAKRIARRCALRGIDQLTRDVALANTELPLYTTCSKFLSTPGDARQAAVTASIDPLPDMGPGAGKRLKSHFSARPSHTLLVLDSLDEAGDPSGIQRARIQGWRGILTSRSGAWTGQWNTTAAGQPARLPPIVADLQPLSYPEDVDAFIHAWFARQPVVEQQLREHISRRYQQSATVPLLLTFYCIAAQEGRIPRYRRELYEQVTTHLLRRRWHPGRASATGLNPALKSVLRAWAWEALTVNPDTGLAIWNDEFSATMPSHELPEADWPLLDSVAAKVGNDDVLSEKTPRRFVHRTLQEHLVAQHLSTIPTDQALAMLLPHLWFDPDWDRVIPMTLADHPRRSELLTRMCGEAMSHGQDSSHTRADWEVDRHLLAVAAESDAGDWTPDASELIHNARIRQATRLLRLIAATAHWQGSNNIVQEAIRSALRAGDPRGGGELQETLAALLHPRRDPSDLAPVGPHSGPEDMSLPPEVRRALASTEPSTTERAEARAAIIQSLPKLTAPEAHIRILLSLDPTPEERARARVAILSGLQTTSPRYLPERIRALTVLDPTALERAQIRAVILTGSPGDGPPSWGLRDRIRTLLALDPTPQELAVARAALTSALVSGEERSVDGLAADLDSLDPTPSGRAKSRLAISDALENAGPDALPRLVRTLAALEPGPAERDQARGALLRAMSARSDPRSLAGLATALSSLDPTTAQRDEAREALVRAIPWSDPRALAGLATALSSLDPTTAQRDEARGALVRAISARSVPRAHAGIAPDLSPLDPTLAERAQDRVPLVMAMDTANFLDRARSGPLELANLSAALTSLNPTSTERARARASIIAAVPRANPRARIDLAVALRELDPTPTERASVIDAIIIDIARADPIAVDDLTTALGAFDPTPEDRAQARAAIARALPTADAWTLTGLVKALISLDAPINELEQAKAAIIRALPTAPAVEDLTRLLRQCSGPSEWISWLRGDRRMGASQFA